MAETILEVNDLTTRFFTPDGVVKAVNGIWGFELAEAGEDLVQGIPCASATAVDGSTHHIMCPMSGKVLEVNEDVRIKPSLVEKDPYFKGWIYRILPSDAESNLQWLNL